MKVNSFMRSTQTLMCTDITYAYLTSKYGNTILLDTENSDHDFIVSTFQKVSKYQPISTLSKDYKYSIDVRVFIGDIYSDSELCNRSIIAINKYFKDKMYQNLFCCVDINVGLNPDSYSIIQDSILKYMEWNNLDPDIINFERLKKAYYRYRKAKNDTHAQ